MSSVVHQVHIAAPLQTVWDEITKTHEVQKPFFDSRMDSELRPGSHLAMRSGDGRMTAVVGEILEIEPPRRLSFTFKFTMHDDPPCRVTYELEEEDGGTRFRMISDHIPEGTKTAKEMTGGGETIVKTLKEVLETGRPNWKTRAMYAVFGLMTPLAPKQTRSDLWPPERCLQEASRAQLP